MRHVWSLLAMVACCVFGTAQDVHAQSYRWVDEHGATHESDTLPPAGTRFLELRVIEGSASLTALERRTLEIVNNAVRELGPLSATPESTHPTFYAGGAEPVFSHASQSPATENTRDPCLLSWDPACYQKHASDYHPRWGYAPSLLRSSRVEPVMEPAKLGTSASLPVH